MSANESISVNNNNNEASDSKELTPSMGRRTLPFHTVIAPVAVDIGGSFSKMVYWRPPDPPDLPSYIIKDFQNGEPQLPLKPDPILKVSLDSGTDYAFCRDLTPLQKVACAF